MMQQPAKIGRFEVVSEIGRGAMGVVYDAVDPMLERVVAIKTINMTLDPGEVEHYEKRFSIEARAAGGLNHPNIVTIYDIGRSGDLAYIAMEFLEGSELRDLIGTNELTIDRALDIAAQVADGLAYAHEHDVVHRDIKPANIMILRDGRVKITDFGIAHMRTAEVRTQTGVVLGSPRYLSPEQVLGKRCNARADIFALGVITYEMVTGQAPFNGTDVNSLMYQIVNFNPVAPSAINPTLPAMLDLIIAKALAKNPDERYASIAELAADLRACRLRCADATTTTMPLRAPPAETADERVPGEEFIATVPTAREHEPSAALPGDALLARGLSKQFDSMAATMRLAEKTGAAADFRGFAAPSDADRDSIDPAVTGAQSDSSRDPSAAVQMHAPPWSQQDRRIFLAAIAGATALGAVIVFI